MVNRQSKLNLRNLCLVPLFFCGDVGADPLATANAVESSLTSYCNTSAYTQSRTVSIGTVTGIGHHRNGYLQVQQTSDAATLKARLLKVAAAAGVPEDCWEYLDGRQLISVNHRPVTEPELLARIYFNFDSAQLTPTSHQILREVAAKLHQSPNTIELAGHTDSTGRVVYNQGLGLRRAAETAQYLESQGVPDHQMKTVSHGEQQPMASNDTVIGREKNRRVEIRTF